MRAGIALVVACAAGGCAELGAPSGGGAPVIDAAVGEPADASIEQIPAQEDAAPITGPVASCAEELERRPAAVNGVYEIDRGDGPEDVYCDMTDGGVSYEELAFGNSFATYDGYTGATAADFAGPGVQQAFIWLYNRQGGGATNIAVGYNSTNCCFKGAGAAAGEVLVFGEGNYLYPADVAMDTANCNATYGGAAYRFMFGDKEIYPPAVLPSDYFATNPPGEITNCSDGDNPGWFFKRF